MDIDVVTGQENDFGRRSERPDALEVTLGRCPGTVTADRAYGIGRVHAALSEHAISAAIPPRPSTRQAKAKGFLIERFPHNPRRGIVRWPRKKVMTSCAASKAGRRFRADATACRTCPLREHCNPDGGATRCVDITKTHVATPPDRGGCLSARARRDRPASPAPWPAPGCPSRGRARCLGPAARPPPRAGRGGG